MDRELEQRIIKALDDLDRGQSPEEILTAFPAEREVVLPILETATFLREIKPRPSQAARANSHRAFLAEASRRRAGGEPRATSTFWRRPLQALVTLLLLLIVAGGLLVSPAESSIPGDPLYSVKRAVENVRLSLAADAGRRAELRQNFNEERVQEIRQMLAAGREGIVDCYGTILDVAGQELILDGYTVHLEPNSRIEGEPVAGASLSGRCRITDGDVFALTLRVDNLPTSPEPQATATPSPTVEAPTNSSPSRVPATPAPSETPAPTPTATLVNAEHPGPVPGEETEDDDDSDLTEPGTDDEVEDEVEEETSDEDGNDGSDGEDEGDNENDQSGEDNEQEEEHDDEEDEEQDDDEGEEQDDEDEDEEQVEDEDEEQDEDEDEEQDEDEDDD